MPDMGLADEEAHDLAVYMLSLKRKLGASSYTPIPRPVDPTPAEGAVGVSSTPTLGWTADESATQDVYLGTDEALVAAGDASVLVSQQTGTGYGVADALGRGTTLYWKVDVTTADGKVHLGFVNSFRVADQNTDNCCKRGA